MLYNLGQQKDRQDFKEYCNQLYKLGRDKGIWVELTQKRHQRTLPQNAYCHVCIALFASEYGISCEEAKYDFFKKRYNPDIFLREKINRRGEKITYVRSSSDLNTEEMTRAIESFRNKVAQEFSLYIPAPDEHDALLEAQREIEKYAAYL